MCFDKFKETHDTLAVVGKHCPEGLTPFVYVTMEDKTAVTEGKGNGLSLRALNRSEMVLKPELLEKGWDDGAGGMSKKRDGVFGHATYNIQEPNSEPSFGQKSSRSQTRRSSTYQDHIIVFGGLNHNVYRPAVMNLTLIWEPILRTLSRIAHQDNASCGFFIVHPSCNPLMTAVPEHHES